MKYIFTCQPNSGKILISELKKEDTTFKFIDWLDGGVGLMESSLTLDEIVELINKTPIIFIRHIFLVQEHFESDSKQTTELWIGILLDKCMKFIMSNLNKELPYSLQIRTMSSNLLKEYKNSLLNNIETMLNNEGYVQDTKNCKQVISIFITKKLLYIGHSFIYQNLSKWNGGMMHCSKENTQISRAGSKLVEAIEVFNIPVEAYKYGLDLGAAPGGWTEVLINYNMEVTAVDPADMNVNLLTNPKLKHYKETTQQFLKRSFNKTYDIILNDMKMDILPSVEIINSFSKFLSENGIVIMTFKLPHQFNYTLIKQGFDELKKEYRIQNARQLFHNRSEITVVCKR